MEQRIKLITEAFSMQPSTLRTQTQEEYENLKKINPKLSLDCCKEIKPETMQVDTDKQCNYYVGYNFEGERIFEYLQSSVNVHYETELPNPPKP